MADLFEGRRRYWSPQAAPIEMDWDGYLPDPEDKVSKQYNTELQDFAQIAERRCLVLLGEPGAGKTTTLRGQLTDRACGHRWLDLKSYSSEVRLIEKLRELAGPGAGDQPITLTLDSFDECLIRIDPLASLLEDEFTTMARERLNLRIVCRPSVWPTKLGVSLAKLWPTVDVFELAPLRRSDVAHAAQTRDIDPDAFLEAVHRHRAQPLAANPVSLKFLLQCFRDTGTLPSTPADLYERGCTALVSFVSDARVGTSLDGRLTSSEAFAIAGRIAALSMLSARPRIAPTLESRDDTVLDLSDIVGGTEPVEGHEVVVDVASVREVLDKPMYTSAGGNLVGFAHRTYAEFLAARHLQRRAISPTQALDLLSDEETRLSVVPQLRGVASWLAALDERLRKVLLGLDPSLLLSQFATYTSPAIKSQVVSALLTATREHRIVDTDIKAPTRYASLAHGGLADQLRQPIADRSTFFVTRRMAIDIAKDCNVVELSDELATVVLDLDSNIYIRHSAARALSKVGSVDARRRLQALLVEGHLDDDADELRGYALRCLWPTHLSTREVIEKHLTPSNPDGEHAHFLHEFANQLDGDDLVPALEWTSRQGRRYGSSPTALRMINTCLRKASTAALTNERVRRPLAYALLSRLRNFDAVLTSDDGDGDDDTTQELGEQRRRTLATILVHELDEQESMPSLVWGSSLVQDADRWWVLAKCQQPHEHLWFKRRWLAVLKELAGSAGAHSDAAFIDAVISLADGDADARSTLTFLQAVEIDSDVARQGRASVERQRAHDAEAEDRRERRTSRPPFDRRAAVERSLQELAPSSAASWLRLTFALSTDDDGIYDRNRVAIVGTPGWSELDQPAKLHVLEAALQHLEASAAPEGWTTLRTRTDVSRVSAVATSTSCTIPYEADAGYRALRLLADVDGLYLDRLSPATWGRWAETILGWFDNESTAQHVLLTRLKRSNASALHDAVRYLSAGERASESSFFFLHRLAGLWDAELTAVAIAEFDRPDVVDEVFERALQELMQQHAPGADDLAIRRISEQRVEVGRRLEILATSLLAHGADPHWTAVWCLIRDDVARGTRILSGALDFQREAKFCQKLSDEEAADLSIWLERHYPSAEDPRHHGVFMPGPLDLIASLKRTLLSTLLHRATEGSYRQLQRMQREKVCPTDFVWTLIAAHRALVARGWSPIAPKQLMRVLGDSRKRVVRSAADLAAVVMSALQDVQDRVQGVTAESGSLWDKQAAKRGQRPVHRPVEETELSDYVKNRLGDLLGDRGIILNREVEIRRGQKSDIYIQVPIGPSGEELVAVVIEVKGCWNADLMTSMHDQLQQRYLANVSNTHGIYLVGWFESPHWDPKDGRLAKTRHRTIETLRTALENQARELSQNGVPMQAFVLDAHLHG
jgi:hypothetical protein